jgi:hypothetical protein
MVEVGRPLPALEVEDAANVRVALASLHEGAPLVAIFLRHFG